MIDWIKALLIGIVLIALLLAGSIILALVVPVIGFAILVVITWFLIQVFKDDGGDDPRKPP